MVDWREVCVAWWIVFLSHTLAMRFYGDDGVVTFGVLSLD